MDKTGRSIRSGRFFRFDHGLATSPAWLSCKPAARAAFLQIAARFDGHNNGRISFSVRECMKECRIANGTAQKALREIEEKGLVDCTKRTGFNMKEGDASEWRINTEPCGLTGQPASRRFRDWDASVANEDTDARSSKSNSRYQQVRSTVSKERRQQRATGQTVSAGDTETLCPPDSTVSPSDTLSRIYHGTTRANDADQPPSTQQHEDISWMF